MHSNFLTSPSQRKKKKKPVEMMQNVNYRVCLAATVVVFFCLKLYKKHNIGSGCHQKMMSQCEDQNQLPV